MFSELQIHLGFVQSWNLWVLTKTRNNLKQPATISNDLQQTRNDLKWPARRKKWPKTTHNKYETTYNDMKLSTTSKKGCKTTNNKHILRLFYIMGQCFPPSIWLKWFERCFLENHGENSTLNICIISCIVNTGHNIYRIPCEPFWHS